MWHFIAVEVSLIWGGGVYQKEGTSFNLIGGGNVEPTS